MIYENKPEIDIPAGFVADFLRSPDPGDLDNDPGSAEGSEKEQEFKKVITGVAERAVSICYNAFDQACKEKGLMGLGKVPESELTELTVLVGEKHIDLDSMKNTPEYLLASALVGIASANYIQFKRMNKNIDKDPEPEHEG